MNGNSCEPVVHSSPRRPQQRLGQLFRYASWFAVPLISMIAGVSVWVQPTAPTWISEDVVGGTCPIGFRPNGDVVCLDSPGNVAAKSTLRIREAATGRVIQTHTLGFAVSDTAEITPDGEWAILRQPFSAPAHQILVTSLNTGARRCPPIADESFPNGKFSPNGQYKAVYPGYYTNTYSMGHIADLSTGQLLYPADQQVMFSPDNERWVALEASGLKWWFVFHSLEDGRELGRSPVPEIPGMSRLLLRNWTRERLEFIAVVANGGNQNSRWYSLCVQGNELAVLQPDPVASDYSPGEQHNWYEKGDGWTIRVSPANWASRGINGRGSWIVLKLLRNPRTRPMTKFHHRWQPISPTTGRPIGRGIVLVEGDEGFNIPMKLAPDGRWLAEAGKRLRVWHVPQPNNLLQRSLWTLLAAAIPWLIFLRRIRGS